MHSVAVSYSINDLARLSGIKAHTIRAWEQRYKLLSPNRSLRNIRFYSDHDLKFLLNISVLIRSGCKISHLSKLSHLEIRQRINNLEKEFSPGEFFQKQCGSLVESMLDLNEPEFDAIISVSVSKCGFEDTMVNLIIPFLGKIGMMWRTGESSVIQEHFVCNLIRKNLCAAIHSLPKSLHSKNDTYVLFLPKNELHELGLLFSEYILRARGKKVIYLGQSVPIDEIIEFSKKMKPDYLLTFFTASYSKDDICSYLSKLCAAISPLPLLMAGNPLLSCGDDFPENTFYLQSVADLIKHVEESNYASADQQSVEGGVVK